MCYLLSEYRYSYSITGIIRCPVIDQYTISSFQIQLSITLCPNLFFIKCQMWHLSNIALSKHKHPTTSVKPAKPWQASKTNFIRSYQRQLLACSNSKSKVNQKHIHSKTGSNKGHHRLGTRPETSTSSIEGETASTKLDSCACLSHFWVSERVLMHLYRLYFQMLGTSTILG